MTAKHATRDAILTYIRLVPFPRPRAAIIKHMARRYGTRPATTRQQLHKLCRAEMLEQVDKDFYQIKAGE